MNIKLKIPLVNVTLTTLNAEKYLRKSIESVLNQDYKNLEFWLVDAYSEDNTVKIAKEFNEVEIFFKEGKMSAGWNYGAFNTDAKYIIFWGRDDIMYPKDRIRKQVKILEESDQIGLLYGNLIWINENGEETNRSKPNHPNSLVRRSLGTFPSSIFRIETVKDLEGLDERLNFVDDWDIQFRIYKHPEWKLEYSDQIFAKYRHHSKQNAQTQSKESREKEKEIMKKSWKEDGLI